MGKNCLNCIWWKYLLNTAKEHIKGNINIAQVQNIIKEENNYTIIKNEVRIQNYEIVKTEKEWKNTTMPK